VPELEPPRFHSLAHLVFGQREHEPDELDPLIIQGCLAYPETCTSHLTLGQLRRTIVALIRRLARHGVQPGDTVALIRLTGTSELPVAVLYVALSTWGVRVLFPMYLEPDALGQWLDACNATTLLVSTRENAVRAAPVLVTATQHQVRVLSLEQDLELPELLLDPPARGVGEPPWTAEWSAPAGASSAEPQPESNTPCMDSECLLLTTSGTTGAAKIVRYTQGALLRCCASWEQAGLLEPHRLGGRGLTLLLAHSMGLRGLWNAIWTRQALCLVTPEWFLEHPERVAALLLEMEPEHVTGGPATFHTLLEFARINPRLKERCFRSLRSLVSSGAAFDPALARRVQHSLGLALHNAFGMTETMQVLSTLVDGPYATTPGTLGNPLPGVRLRLVPDGDSHRLWVSSPFGFAGYLDGSGLAQGWFSTGDMVRRDGDALTYVGRQAGDFINDGFGLKISRARLERSYADLDHESNRDLDDFRLDDIAFFPLQREPGLAALLFGTHPVVSANGGGLGGGVEPGQQALSDHRLLTRFRSLLEQRLERLQHGMDALQFQQLAIGRFALVDGPAPRTSKGTLSHGEIARRHAGLIQHLTGPYRKHPAIGLVHREHLSREASVRLTSPRIGEMLGLLAMDKQFEGGSGDRLWYLEHGVRREVVDFVGGYGGNLLGHRHPALTAALQEFLAGDAVPVLDQGSTRRAQGALARQLSLIVGHGSHIVRFGSTGAEVVEMALAHACLEREERVRHLVRDQKRRFGHHCPDRVRLVLREIEQRIAARPRFVLAIEGAYHGHSQGARSVTHSAKMRIAGMSALQPIFIPRDTTAGQLDALVHRHRTTLPLLQEQDGEIVEQSVQLDDIVAAIAEPIQGEGGVWEVPAALMRELGRFEFPLILDEIQSGMGRSGRFLASTGIQGHYYLLSKALGGGLVKIAALILDRQRYVNRFDELYASTFAGDALSCHVASRVLQIIERERIPARCLERGQALRLALEAVQHRHPRVLREVRGRGLILALQLDRQALGDSFTLRTLADRDLLGALAASYMLNRHAVRLLPTLSAPDALRVEPSAFIDDDAIAQLTGGLEQLCQHLERLDASALLSHLVRDESALDHAAPETDVPHMSVAVVQPARDACRVAFVLHFVHPERELTMVDPSLSQMPRAARRALARRLMGLMQLRPAMTFAHNLFHGKVWFAVILLPADVALLETLHRMDYRFLETERLQQAVDLAAGMGCSAVALGGYTSIIARDGDAILPPPGVQITSGNTFTTVVSACRIMHACQRAGIDPAAHSTRVGVVGATGNIGSALIHRLTRGPSGFGSFLMLGRDLRRLEQVRHDLADQRLDLRISTDIAALAQCNVVAIATNTNEPLLYPQHLDPHRPVLVADVSVPTAVSRQVCAMSNVQVIPLAGTVVVPGASDLLLSSHTPPGAAFCCAAEAMLMGLEREATSSLRLTGRVDPHSMDVMHELGQKHGLLETLLEGGFKLG